MFERIPHMGKVSSSDELIISVKKNQITFSKKLLAKYGLKAGSKVDIEVDRKNCLIGILLNEHKRPLYQPKTGEVVMQTPVFLAEAMATGVYYDTDMSDKDRIVLRGRHKPINILYA